MLEGDNLYWTNDSHLIIPTIVLQYVFFVTYFQHNHIFCGQLDIFRDQKECVTIVFFWYGYLKREMATIRNAPLTALTRATFCKLPDIGKPKLFIKILWFGQIILIPSQYVDLFLKVRQSYNGFFQADNSSKKPTNQFGFFCQHDQIVVFVFWKNLRIAKSFFKINWPLALTNAIWKWILQDQLQTTKSFPYQISNLQMNIFCHNRNNHFLSFRLLD